MELSQLDSKIHACPGNGTNDSFVLLLSFTGSRMNACARAGRRQPPWNFSRRAALFRFWFGGATPMAAKRVIAAFVVMAFLAAITIAALAAEKAYLGNKNSKKYHVAACTWAQKIAPRNRIEFSTAEEAKKAGFIPCKICRPDRSHPIP